MNMHTMMAQWWPTMIGAIAILIVLLRTVARRRRKGVPEESEARLRSQLHALGFNVSTQSHLNRFILHALNNGIEIPVHRRLRYVVYTAGMGVEIWFTFSRKRFCTDVQCFVAGHSVPMVESEAADSTAGQFKVISVDIRKNPVTGLSVYWLHVADDMQSIDVVVAPDHLPRMPQVGDVVRCHAGVRERPVAVTVDTSAEVRARMAYLHAYSLHADADTDAAIARYVAAMEAFENYPSRRGSLDDFLYLLTIELLGDVCREARRHGDALTWYTHAIAQADFLLRSATTAADDLRRRRWSALFELGRVQIGHDAAQSIVDITTLLQEYLEEDDTDDHFVQACYHNRGVAHANLEQWNDAIEDYTSSLEIQQSIRARWGGYAWSRHGYLLTLTMRARVYSRTNHLDAALRDYDEAIHVGCAVGSSMDTEHLAQIGELYHERGHIQRRRLHFTEAVDDFRQAIRMRTDLIAGGHDAEQRLGDSVNARGWTYFDQGDWERAIVDLRRAREIRRQLLQRDPSTDSAPLGWTLAHLGRALMKCNRQEECRQYFEEAILLYEGTPARWDENANAHLSLGFACHELQQYDDAITLFMRAIALWDAKMPSHEYQPDANYAQTLHNLGLSWTVLDHSKQAIECYTAAILVRTQLYEKQTGIGGALAYSYENRGRVRYKCFAHAQARDDFAQAIDLRRKHPIADAYSTARSLVFLHVLYGRAHCQLRDVHRAIRELTIALSYAEQGNHDGSDDATLMFPCLLSRGYYRSIIGDATGALADSERGLRLYCLPDGSYPAHTYSPVSSLLHNQGLALRAGGREELARIVFEQALQMREHVLTESQARDSTLAEIMLDCALADWHHHREDVALDKLDRAITTWDWDAAGRFRGYYHRYAAAHVYRAQLLLHSGQFAASTRTLATVYALLQQAPEAVLEPQAARALQSLELCLGQQVAPHRPEVRVAGS